MAGSQASCLLFGGSLCTGARHRLLQPLRNGFLCSRYRFADRGSGWSVWSTGTAVCTEALGLCPCFALRVLWVHLRGTPENPRVQCVHPMPRARCALAGMEAVRVPLPCQMRGAPWSLFLFAQGFAHSKCPISKHLLNEGLGQMTPSHWQSLVAACPSWG